MTTTGYGATDWGRGRETNEDAFCVDDRLGLYAVCDGVAGHPAGELASREAIAVLRQFLYEREDRLEHLRQSTVADSEAIRFVEDAVQQTCHALHFRAQAAPEHAGMGNDSDHASRAWSARRDGTRRGQSALRSA